MNLRALMEIAELLPPGGAVTLPRDALLEALADVTAPAPIPAGDLTVHDLAAHFRRSTSTVRDWLAAGRFAGAYKLNGRDWRVPPSGMTAFTEAQLHGKANLGAWRTRRRA